MSDPELAAQGAEAAKHTSAQHAFEILRDARLDLQVAHEQARTAESDFATELNRFKGRLVSFIGKPTSRTQVYTHPNGHKSYVAYPRYKRVDESSDHFRYDSCILLGADATPDGPVVRVSFPAWGEDFETIPAHSIFDFELDEQTYPAAEQSA